VVTATAARSPLPIQHRRRTTSVSDAVNTSVLVGISYVSVSAGPCTNVTHITHHHYENIEGLPLLIPVADTFQISVTIYLQYSVVTTCLAGLLETAR
jgi:hypothetical protein